MVTAPDFPSVPAEKLDGWELVEESVETLFQLPAVRVVGATRQYEDEQLRRAVRDASDGEIDHRWRFFAATRLGFDPMLPPGTMPSMILPTMRSEAKKTFKKRLQSRDVEDIERGRRERVRIRSGKRARLVRYDGVDPIASGVPVTGWVGVWNDGTDFFVVTGGYPARPLSEALDLEESADGLDRTGNEAQGEFLDMLRDVQ
ncbi:MAG: hypothetical protein V5A45_00510 [Haloarculaceae archaeon]